MDRCRKGCDGGGLAGLRNLALAGVIGLAAVAVAASPLAEEPGFGAPPAADSGRNAAAAPGLSMQFLQNPQGPPTIVLLDPQQPVLAVYHVDPATGRITLKSVRRVLYDLRMDQFETDKPLPTDLRDAQR